MRSSLPHSVFRRFLEVLHSRHGDTFDLAAFNFRGAWSVHFPAAPAPPGAKFQKQRGTAQAFQPARRVIGMQQVSPRHHPGRAPVAPARQRPPWSNIAAPSRWCRRCTSSPRSASWRGGSSLGGLIRQCAALRSTSRHPTVIGSVLGIQGSSCLSSTPSGLSLLNYPELPPSTSAGSLVRALPSFFRTSSGHRVRGGNPWHSKFQRPTSRWGGFRRLVRSLSLRPFWLLASLVGRSGSRPPLSTFTSGLSAVRVAPVGCRI